MKNEGLKVITFPGAPTQAATQKQNIVITGHKLGEGCFGVVRLGYD
jgi:hypothetical protein